MPFQHFTTPGFWKLYHALPQEIQDLADKNFALLKSDPSHPSLHFKKVGALWSARVGRHYRVIATEREEGLVWSWIGPHAEYDHLLP